MATGTTPPRRLRVWPAIVWPLGATLLFLGGGALFINKIASDQEKADLAALRLESYARLEAGELASRARTLAHSFVQDRLDRRAEQERSQHQLLNGVMEGVQRVLGAGLEKSRNALATSREVGDFPVGFEGLRAYLELSGTVESSGDSALAALRACAPELAALLPSGSSLTVVENNAAELLSLGGGPVPENARTESLAREFIWGEGASSRHWTLLVSLTEPDQHPFPDAAELSAYLGEQLGRVALDNTAWKGWLVDRSGRTAASFPALPEQADAPPYVEAAEEWIDVDSRRLVWMNRAARLEQIGLAPAVAVAIDRPTPPLVPAEVFVGDLRWSSFLTAFALLSIGLWVWFARAMVTGRGGLSSRRAAPVAAPAANKKPPAREIPATTPRALPKQRLVRAEKPEPEKAATESPDLIVADIDDAGEVHVETVVRPRQAVPSGSLLRLQERHRGGRNKEGSRVLDNARSRVLRELAERVRPIAQADVGRSSSGRITERIAPMKSPDGWDKVS